VSFSQFTTGQKLFGADDLQEGDEPLWTMIVAAVVKDVNLNTSRIDWARLLTDHSIVKYQTETTGDDEKGTLLEEAKQIIEKIPKAAEGGSLDQDHGPEVFSWHRCQPSNPTST